MSHDDIISNKSGNRPFHEVFEVNKNRREILVGSMTLAATTFFVTPDIALADYDKRKRKKTLVDFEPIPLPITDADGNRIESTAVPRISPDYEYQVLIPWGEPLTPGGPAFSYPPSAADQMDQIGIGHDGMWFFPAPLRRGRHRWGNYNDKYSFETGNFRITGSSQRGMLAINHEFGRNTHVYNKPAPESLEDVRVSQHAHGVSIVAIEKRGGKWRTRRSRNARRIHVNTPVNFSGPVAGHPLLQTKVGNDPLGTVNNCANGYTPWGTYLTCEENFNGYFGDSTWNGETGEWVATEEQARYGFSPTGFSYGWEDFDARFDLSLEDVRNEENRFGWVVEIDPYDGSKRPVKRTALGRVKHEGVAIGVGKQGRVVAYMGDDQRFDYIYKFVSAYNWKTMRRHGISPLDKGKLYVARFNDDSTGDWLELTIHNPVLAERFEDQAEVLTYARIAADLLGATPMDRPEWTTIAPGGEVYCTLTNNSNREEPNAANPLAPNSDGHIIRWKDTERMTGTRFTWDIFVFAQDTHGTPESFADPDGIWTDEDGRLFIQTDGGQKDNLNNQMLVANLYTGEIKRIFEGVSGDEITGIALTPDRRTMFINTQHPGNGDPSRTNFPVMNEVADPNGPVPRDATFVLTKKDGGIIGS